MAFAKANPLPPPVDVGNRLRSAERVVDRALLETTLDVEPRRVIWAVGRAVTELFQELDRRSLLPDDRVERVLQAVDAWCAEEGSAQDAKEEASALRASDYEPYHQLDPYGITHAYTRGSSGGWLRMATIRLGDSADLSRLGRTELLAKKLRSAIDAVKHGWQSLGEEEGAADVRVLRSVREGLRRG